MIAVEASVIAAGVVGLDASKLIMLKEKTINRFSSFRIDFEIIFAFLGLCIMNNRLKLLNQINKMDCKYKMLVIHFNCFFNKKN